MIQYCDFKKLPVFGAVDVTAGITSNSQAIDYLLLGGICLGILLLILLLK